MSEITDADFHALENTYRAHMARFCEGNRKARPAILELLVELERREAWERIAPHLAGIVEPPAFSIAPPQPPMRRN